MKASGSVPPPISGQDLAMADARLTLWKHSAMIGPPSTKMSHGAMGVVVVGGQYYYTIPVLCCLSARVHFEDEGCGMGFGVLFMMVICILESYQMHSICWTAHHK